MRMIIVSGLSGAGKSVALQTLEDLDYFCVDNLPVTLLGAFAEAIRGREPSLPHPAVVGIDARNFSDELTQFPALLDELRASGLQVEIVFLLADEATLLKRYSDTRRKHPLSVEGLPLADAIARERRLLEAIAEHADLTIDTSRYNVHQLRDLVRERIHGHAASTVSILFESFGFKRGLPADADFVFDVRGLPNPHWDPHLRQLTGRDAQVIAFLRQQPIVDEMLADMKTFLGKWIPTFETGTRSYLTVAIGCTGGQHRSVYIAEVLAAHFRASRPNVMARHRDLASA